MSVVDRAFTKFADPYSPTSFGYKARAKRMQMLLERFPDFSEMKVVDLGGNTLMWQSTPVRPAHVTVVDIGEWALTNPEPWMTLVQGDACRLETVSGDFDLVFSNSLIEHVGGPRYRRDMADVVHALAPHHWIQTPYRYFPLEPHFIFPGFQFMPLSWRMQIFKRWPLVRSIWDRTEVADRVSLVTSHELLSKTEMVDLFPGSELIQERAVGLVKSLIATR